MWAGTRGEERAFTALQHTAKRNGSIWTIKNSETVYGHWVNMKNPHNNTTLCKPIQRPSSHPRNPAISHQSVCARGKEPLTRSNMAFDPLMQKYIVFFKAPPPPPPNLLVHLSTCIKGRFSSKIVKKKTFFYSPPHGWRAKGSVDGLVTWQSNVNATQALQELKAKIMRVWSKFFRKPERTASIYANFRGKTLKKTGNFFIPPNTHCNYHKAGAGNQELSVLKSRAEL